MDCDIIGFQEVFSRSELQSVLKDLGFAYFATVDTAKIRKKHLSSMSLPPWLLLQNILSPS
ncbi:MAG: hypothetical protein Q9M36_00135 [Sulfurovum sp.]|nr:hypothetical protein [Sulfurovum sp.]